MPGSYQYSTMLDGTRHSISNIHSDKQSANGSFGNHARSGSVDSLDSNSSSGISSAGGHSRQLSSDSTEFIPTRSLNKAPTVPSRNPLQFIKVNTPALYHQAETQVKLTKEAKISKDKLKEDEEEWQTNLDSWKSRRRKQSEKLIQRAEEMRLIEEQDQMRQMQQQKTKVKTFSEIVERKSRTKRNYLALYMENEDENKIAGTSENEDQCNTSSDSQHFLLRSDVSDVTSETESVGDSIDSDIHSSDRFLERDNIRSFQDKVHISQLSSLRSRSPSSPFDLQRESSPEISHVVCDSFTKLDHSSTEPSDIDATPAESEQLSSEDDTGGTATANVDSGLESLCGSNRAGDIPDSASDFSQDSCTGLDKSIVETESESPFDRLQSYVKDDEDEGKKESIKYDRQPVNFDKARQHGEELNFTFALKHSSDSRGFGFTLKGGSDQGARVLVDTIAYGSPSHLAGLKPGDEILTLNEESTTGRSHSALVFAIKQAVYTGQLSIVVWRSSEQACENEKEQVPKLTKRGSLFAQKVAMFSGPMYDTSTVEMRKTLKSSENKGDSLVLRRRSAFENNSLEREQPRKNRWSLSLSQDEKSRETSPSSCNDQAIEQKEDVKKSIDRKPVPPPVPVKPKLIQCASKELLQKKIPPTVKPNVLSSVKSFGREDQVTKCTVSEVETLECSNVAAAQLDVLCNSDSNLSSREPLLTLPINGNESKDSCEKFLNSNKTNTKDEEEEDDDSDDDDDDDGDFSPPCVEDIDDESFVVCTDEFFMFSSNEQSENLNLSCTENEDNLKESSKEINFPLHELADISVSDTNENLSGTEENLGVQCNDKTELNIVLDLVNNLNISSDISGSDCRTLRHADNDLSPEDTTQNVLLSCEVNPEEEMERHEDLDDQENAQLEEYDLSPDADEEDRLYLQLAAQSFGDVPSESDSITDTEEDKTVISCHTVEDEIVKSESDNLTNDGLATGENPSDQQSEFDTFNETEEDSSLHERLLVEDDQQILTEKIIDSQYEEERIGEGDASEFMENSPEEIIYVMDDNELILDELSVPTSGLEPPKEKPPPPPPEMDFAESKTSSFTRANSTKRIKKEISRRRTDFLGLDPSETVDLDIPPPPPRIEEILKSEMELAREQRQWIESRLSLPLEDEVAKNENGMASGINMEYSDSSKEIPDYLKDYMTEETFIQQLKNEVESEKIEESGGAKASSSLEQINYEEDLDACIKLAGLDEPSLNTPEFLEDISPQTPTRQSIHALGSAPKAKIMDSDKWIKQADKTFQMGQNSMLSYQNGWKAQEPVESSSKTQFPNKATINKRYSMPQYSSRQPDVVIRTWEDRPADCDVYQNVRRSSSSQANLCSSGNSWQQRSNLSSNVLSNGHHLKSPTRAACSSQQAGLEEIYNSEKQLVTEKRRNQCAHCGKELAKGTAMGITDLQLYFHIQCFCCFICKTELGNGSCGTDVQVRDNRLYCTNCFHKDTTEHFL